MAIGGEIALTQKAEGGAIGADLAVMAGADADHCKLPTGANVRAKGITALKADAAEKAIPVIILGPAVGTAASAIAVGDAVETADATGKLRTASPVAAANSNVVGFALTAAAADGDKFDLIVVPSVKQG